MTKPDPSAVATMQGRELDAALCERLFGWTEVVKHDIGWHYRDRTRDSFVQGWWHSVPHYSDDPAAFFAMVKKVRDAGWMYFMWEDADGHNVRLVRNQHSEMVESIGDTLPLAFARAALLTTYSKEQS